MTVKTPAAVKSVVTGSKRGAKRRSLYDRVREFRNGLGLTQAQFADLIGGVNMATVSHWENNRPPQFEHFAQMMAIAREQGGLMALLGLDDYDLIDARFQSLNPKKGAVMFLEFTTAAPAEIDETILEICKLGGQLHTFAAVGARSTRALVLVVVPDSKTMDEICAMLKDSEQVKDPHASVRINDTVLHPLDNNQF